VRHLPRENGIRVKARRWTELALWCALVLVGDQLVKRWVVERLAGGRGVDLLGSVLRLSYVTNKGGAFGLLNGMGGVMLVVSVLVLGLLVILAWRLPLGESGLLRAAYGWVLGGALSNVADRLLRGHVVDYINLEYGKRHLWPAFNLGDAGITVGLIVMLLMQARQAKERG
jgi:signal peptidase II